MGWTEAYPLRRRLGALVATGALLASGLTVATGALDATPAAAASGDAFDPTVPTVFISQTQATQLYRSETKPDGTFSFTQEGGPQAFTYNAIGYDTKTRYIYGIVSENGTEAMPTGSVIRIGQDGAATRIGSSTFVGPTGSSNFQSGAVGVDGFYYIWQQGTATALKIDLTDGTLAEEITMSAPSVWADFTFADGFAWTLTPEGALVRLNFETGAVTTLQRVVTDGTGAGFGAAWTFGNGNLGFSDNGSGNVYQFKVGNPAAAEPTVELISVSAGPSSSTNDGTAIPGLPADLSVEKSAAAEHSTDGQVSYSITVTNNGDGASSGWTVSDAFPEGLGDPTVLGDITNSFDPETRTLTVTGGRLEAGEKFTFTVVATSSVPAGECIVNTATVIGNERDDDASNNTDDARSCAVAPVRDFGDAPDSFATLATSDGARHIIPGYDEEAGTAPVMLGKSITAETDGQPGAAADGDKADDGVVFNPELGYKTATLRTGTDPNTAKPAENTLRVNASGAGFVSAWVDWNQDGDFDDEGERVATAQPVNAGANDLTFSQGENPASIRTYVRVRYSTDAAAIATPRGQAPDGEVEDYQVLVERLVRPATCVANDTAYYAFTFENRVEAEGDGSDGENAPRTYSRFADVTVIDGVAVDAVVERIAGTMNPGDVPPNGIGTGKGGVIGTDDVQWQINGSATLRYSFFEAGTDTPIDINGVFTVNDMDGFGSFQEYATFSSADLAGYSVSEGSLVTITEGDGKVTFKGNGNNGTPQSRFQVVLEGVNTFETEWRGGGNSGFGFDGDGDIAISPACSDFGDAPDSYATTLEADGARHKLTAGVQLGEAIDFEPNGLPTAAADGDDKDRLADEDGVKFNADLGYPNPTLRSGLDPNTMSPVENVLSVTASAAGFVSVWVDWNVDGDFDDEGERVANAQAVVAGANDISFEHGENAVATQTYVRVRYSTDAAAIAAPRGAAPDGEVEDYRVLVERFVPADVCLADTAYYSFSFTEMAEQLGTGGPGSSTRFPNVTVVDGVAVDMRATLVDGSLVNNHLAPPNGFGTTAGDSTPGDEIRWQVRSGTSQVRFDFFVAGTDTPVKVNAAYTFADLDGGESVRFKSSELASYAVAEGSAVTITEADGSVLFTGNGSWNNDPESRFQITLKDSDSFTAWSTGGSGSAFMFDGSGDFAITPACADFGDAPDTFGTTLDADGARHQLVKGLGLGDKVDFDADGQPTPGADGDDTNRVADEDAIADAITVIRDVATTVTVSATNDTAEAATLAGWIDLNGNGTFDAAERATIAVPANSGSADYRLVFPAAAPTVDSTFARFRLFPGTVADPAPTGVAAGGEVEDHTVAVRERALEIEKTSDATADTRVGDVVTYTVTATNTGNGDYTADSPAIVLDDLSGVLDDGDYNGDAKATVDGKPAATPAILGDLLSWSGPLPAGDTVTITYTVTLTAGGDGSVRNVAFASTCDPADEDCETQTPPCTDERKDCDEEQFELPRLTITKTADTRELPAVGESVTYTITVTNAGPGDYTSTAPATMTDDLTDVLDAATFNDDAKASTGKVAYDEPKLSWSGALESGQSAVITFTVTYTAEGDRNLRNNACVPESEVLPGAAPCDYVQIPGAGLSEWKQVSSSDTPAVAGSVLTYTLFFKNDGEAGAKVDHIDDLTHVLDDGDVSAEPTSADGLNVTRDGERIAITGTVPAGKTYTVSYQVTLRADGERGDNTAANYVMRNDPKDPPTPPEKPECEPVDEQYVDCTVTPIAEVTYSKAVAASTDPIGEGTVLTYTITVKNTGTATGAVSREDVLTGVLDDADLTSKPVSDTESVTVTDVVDERFGIAGELAAGETATITYKVTVRAQKDRGDNQADNFLVQTGGKPPVTCEQGSTQCTSTPLPFITSAKSVSPESGSTVVAGQQVTYTLTFRNSGGGAGALAYTDHLTGVLDDATLTAGPTASDAALTAQLQDETLAVSGVLAGGQTVTVSYTVTVLPDGERGDNRLANVLAPSDTEDPQCGEPDVSCTENPIPELDDWKTVNPASGSSVQPGQVVEYTLHFENTGEAPLTLNREDVLTQVLDDATVTTTPRSSDAALSVSDIVDGRFAVTGTLEPGQHVTVTYAVTVNADGARGDDRLGNFLVPTGEQPDPECAPADGERADCTVNHVSHVVASKSSDPKSGTELEEGRTVTYTLSFTNVSKNADSEPAPVDYTDHMVDVLDDATLTDGPTVSDDALTAERDGDSIRITGTLPAGETVTVTYTVTVKEWASQGDHHLGNVVAVTGEEPVCAPDSPLCTSHDLVKNPPLARTGAELAWPLLGMAFMLVLGGAVLFIARRRQESSEFVGTSAD